MVLELVLSDKEYNDFENFFKKYKNSLFHIKGNKVYFNSRFSNTLEKIDINIKVLNFNNPDEIEKIIENTLNKTFEISKNNKTNKDDFEYRDNNDTFLSSMVNICIYEEIKDIIDFISKLFICILQSHKLKNGNKRFSFMFLNMLLRYLGFYLKWTEKTQFVSSKLFDTNYSNNEYLIYSFVTKLQNRNFTKNDINNLIDTKSENGKFLEKCLNDIIINYSDKSINERHLIVKQEIYNWLKDNIIIRY
ncbi:death-on-curing family protein [Mycoplasmopsis maculosa]|uniref:Death-on-curing family protein n=1 Tax=Mycoplasmopsis maculosa TaxID=114885 RepID=A0A449B5A8_9BACT|nr:type II toxin-antitoxin system death-on-curing family toxin [Mycoplasmopsis maculosa]VEU75756.1 death-on-curing family protein [Mycoplasmopsis maculosa]